MSPGRTRIALYGLFTLSGFAGLIYESIWSHYLKLFLGHAAYAQTLVLVIFMGGMAVGAWLSGDLSPRLERPLMAYAWVEAMLGVCAMAFDPAFRGLQAWVFDHAIPALASPGAIDALKWSLAALAILPQSVLLGATFPLMSAGVVRLDASIPGRSLAWLYFTNSLGAAVGVLVSGFALIGAVGLPGTLLTAGFVNFALAAIVWLMARGSRPAQPVSWHRAVDARRAGMPFLLLAAAFLTGAASFLYEIGWIRMLTLVLGAATHSFELMLSAFILGLALGSFFIRGRIERLADPIRTLAWIQAAMGALAVASLAVYGQSFEWMSYILASLQRNDSGYVFFNLASHGICLALMLPVTFMAGMTLPLITAILLRSGSGEAGIGRVYAANTLGAIAGILLAVHVVMPHWGLKQVIVAGAALDIALGAWLMLRARGPLALPQRAAFALLLVAAVAVAAAVRLDPARLASSVFRYGGARNPNDVVFHRDGKTASVDVTRNPRTGLLALLTNGKVDASYDAKASTPDDYTMVLSAALPLLLHPGAKTVAVVGMGSGRTTHSFLESPSLARVDTVEIEPAVVDGARLFGRAVSRTFDDPRSHVYIEDAKTFFARHRSRYDIIMSEPSNPWVSGVASLFSAQFYGQVRRYLEPGGLFVQWLQLYEFDLPLLGSVLEALGSQFDDYAIYATNGGDILIAAVPHGRVPPPAPGAFESSPLRDVLATIDVRSPADIALRRIGDKRELARFVAETGSPANSDYRPYVDQNAVKRRFLRSDATDFERIGDINRELAPAPAAGADASASAHYPIQDRAAQARVVAEYFAWQDGRRGPPPGTVTNSLLEVVVTLRSLHSQCEPRTLQAVWVPAMRRFADAMIADLDAQAVRDIVGDLRGARCYAGAPAEVREWIDFLEAAALRRDADVRRHGEALVRMARASGDPVPDVVARELLLADLRSGDAKAARARLADLGKDLAGDAPGRYLRARVAALLDRGQR
ncbi:MAG TPA: fused MFS/spermidine synthase [Usitatibacter sp.]|nr:fused MFS/spermidine synthase [Usitatibacter sp.]